MSREAVPTLPRVMIAAGRLRPEAPAAAQAVGIALLLALGLWYPLLFGAFVLTYVVARFRSGWPLALTVIVFVTALLAWMNTQKALLGDWVWYTEHFRLLTVRSFGDYLGQQLPPFTIKSSEPVYYAVSFIVARLTGGDVAVLAVVVSILVYVPVGLAAATVARAVLGDSAWVGWCVAVAMLGGVTFTITTQLIRQEIAAAFLLLGFVLLHMQRRWSGACLLVLALLCHNSVVIPFAAVVAAWMLVGAGHRVRWLATGAVAAAFLVAGLVYIRLPTSEGYAAVLKNDGSISLLVFALDITLFAGFVVVSRRLSLTAMSRLPAVLCTAVVIYVGFLAGVASAPVPFLRMYLHLEMARVVLITVLMSVAARSRLAIVLVVPAFLCTVAYIELRIAASPFTYHGGFVVHLFSPILFGSPLGR